MSSIVLCEKLKCAQCNCTAALLWKSISDTQHMCNDCFEQTKNNTKQEIDGNNQRKPDRSKLRKSTRSTRYSGKNGTGSNQLPGTSNSNSSKTSNTKPSGRGRRSLFRRPPMKAPTIPASTHHVKSLFYKGSYIQIGDIVSLCNSNYDVFYAQIRGLLVDNFCEKSAVISWLLPTQSSPPPNEEFDPSTYIIGPEEDHPRLLSCMEFVMHAPSDYYMDKTTPYPPVDTDVSTHGGGFIWTSIDAIQKH
ncbi:GATA zinc finger domain-containing protein 1 [Contarinia nasturtii]|uniref:GATA zinc finger domain-containing protein 1 n=1 Tax=Contarinia nasturtii TaxID=265458 RepID=UPI0012D47C58|nr:GATA zinc finger domain-containing protein 1 [Contarinia nasturtii]